MGLIVNTAPTTEPVSLAEAKLHLRVDGDDDDSLIATQIKAATQWCEALTRRQFVTATKTLYLAEWPTRCEEGLSGVIRVPTPKLQSVTWVKYYDADGTLQTLSSSTGYQVLTNADIGRIAPAYGASWPSLRCSVFNPIEVKFVCGYGAASAVPEQVKAAILMLLGHLYRNRESEITGTITSKFEVAAERLLDGERIWLDCDGA